MSALRLFALWVAAAFVVAVDVALGLVVSIGAELAFVPVVFVAVFGALVITFTPGGAK